MAFSHYKSLTLAASQAGSGDSTDWPLAISLDDNVQAADADLKTVGNGGYVENANGYDIRPYADSALTTPLDYELVFYDGATGKLEMHIKIPALSASVDTVIYLAFGDSGISTDGSSTGAWNSGFKAVYHFPNGSSLSLNDSTSEGNDGTNNGVTATAGQMDGGGEFNPASIFLPNNMRDADAVGTISAWARITGDEANNSIFTATVQGDDDRLLNFFVTGGFPGVQAYSLTLGFNDFVVGDSNLANNAWGHFAIVSNGSAWTFHLNGIAITSTPSVGSNSGRWFSAIAIGTTNYTIGDLNTTYPRFFDGKADELRVSNVARNADWHLADFNSQKASSTFISWGALTSTTGRVHIPPVADVAAGSWTPSTGTDLFAMVDEASPANDSDYIESSGSPTTAKLELDTVAAAENLTVKVRGRYV